MTVFAYLGQESEGDRQFEDAKEAVERYAEQGGVTLDHIISEIESNKLAWEQRKIGRLVSKGIATSGDMIVTYEAANLVRSTCQMMELLMAATSAGINIYFVKYQQMFLAQERNNLSDLLILLQAIESDFISRRTTDALARRRAAGLPLGRPKGRKNKSLKLDKHRKEIMKYLDLGISKASIAKLVGCHPQTLYDWIDRQEISVGNNTQHEAAEETRTVETA